MKNCDHCKNEIVTKSEQQIRLEYEQKGEIILNTLKTTGVILGVITVVTTVIFGLLMRDNRRYW